MRNKLFLGSLLTRGEEHHSTLVVVGDIEKEKRKKGGKIRITEKVREEKLTAVTNKTEQV